MEGVTGGCRIDDSPWTSVSRRPLAKLASTADLSRSTCTRTWSTDWMSRVRKRSATSDLETGLSRLSLRLSDGGRAPASTWFDSAFNVKPK